MKHVGAKIYFNLCKILTHLLFTPLSSWYVQHNQVAISSDHPLLLYCSRNHRLVFDQPNKWYAEYYLYKSLISLQSWYEWCKCINTFLLKEHCFPVSTILAPLLCHHPVEKWAQCQLRPLFSFGSRMEMQERLRKVLRTEEDEFFNTNDLISVVFAFVLKLWSQFSW